jgi:3',5'-cyclic AMP phosphodiesterase CpdA
VENGRVQSRTSTFRRVRDLWDPDFLAVQLRRLQARPRPGLTEEQFAAAAAELATRPVPGAGVRAFVPHHPALNLLQTTLETCLRLRGAEALEPPGVADPHLPDAQLRPGIDVYRQFGPCDPRWIECELARGMRLFEDRPPFPATPAEAELADDARVVLVGDWGTGLPAAEAVGRIMGRELEAAAGRDRHLIHLGDVYYAGWREEYLDHFLAYWPHALGDDGIRSWALNGNHDMCSGGHGYFGLLLRDRRFAAQAGSSYFRIAGRHWQILGLDTAYLDQDLAGDQAEWVREQVLGSRLRTILLTHHQLLSVYDQVPGRLRARLGPTLREHPADAWFWGHEHRCLLYAPDPLVRWPRCIGHGGIPMLVPPPNAPLPAGVEYEYRQATVLGPDRWGLFGFAVLDFQGSAVLVRYVNERGEVHHQETLAA